MHCRRRVVVNVAPPRYQRTREHLIVDYKLLFKTHYEMMRSVLYLLVHRDHGMPAYLDTPRAHSG